MFRQRRLWWTVLGSIILVGALLRFTGYRFGLPYFQNFDEPWFFYEALFQRGLLPWWLHPNPSQGLIGLYKLAQIIAEGLTHQAATRSVTEIIISLRFVSVILSLVTLVIIGLCARELAGDIAGWLAAAIWAVIPLVVYHSFTAIAEPWMMLLGALALYTAVLTLRRESIIHPLLSVWAGLAAFTFKYSMFSFAGIGLLFAAWRFLTVPPSQRTRWGRVIAFQIASIVIFLAWMVAFGGMIKDVSSPSREMAQVIQQPLTGLTKEGIIPKIVYASFWQLGTTPLLFAGLYLPPLVWIIRSNRLRKNNLLAP